MGLKRNAVERMRRRRRRGEGEEEEGREREKKKVKLTRLNNGRLQSNVRLFLLCHYWMEKPCVVVRVEWDLVVVGQQVSYVGERSVRVDVETAIVGVLHQTIVHDLLPVPESREESE